MRIHLKNLRLRTIVGVNDWEQREPQGVRINVRFEFDGRRAAETDALEDTVDYSAMKRRIAEMVEGGRFQLIERLASEVLELVMADPRITRATVEVDKPTALRFADGVSVTVSAEKDR